MSRKVLRVQVESRCSQDCVTQEDALSCRETERAWDGDGEESGRWSADGLDSLAAVERVFGGRRRTVWKSLLGSKDFVFRAVDFFGREGYRCWHLYHVKEGHFQPRFDKVDFNSTCLILRLARWDCGSLTLRNKAAKPSLLIALYIYHLCIYYILSPSPSLYSTHVIEYNTLSFAIQSSMLASLFLPMLLLCV